MAAQMAVVWAFSTVETLVRGTVDCWVVYSVVPMADPKESMKAVPSGDATVARKAAPLVVSMESSTAARTELPTVDKKADSTVPRSVDEMVGPLVGEKVEGTAAPSVAMMVAWKAGLWVVTTAAP
jgi:hypothetical protein